MLPCALRSVKESIFSGIDPRTVHVAHAGIQAVSVAPIMEECQCEGYPFTQIEQSSLRLSLHDGGETAPRTQGANHQPFAGPQPTPATVELRHLVLGLSQTVQGCLSPR